MGEFFLTLLIFIGVMAVTAILFGGWLIMTVARSTGRVVGSVLGIQRTPKDSEAGRPCPHIRCQQQNPVSAKFCRRCGRSMEPASMQNVASGNAPANREAAA